MLNSSNNLSHYTNYSKNLQQVLAHYEWEGVHELAKAMLDCWKQGQRVFICGNGGSAGNASHLANDFLYGIAKRKGSGLKINALSDNSAVITCLANDVGYDFIFSEQLAVQGQKGDLLIVLSGSGNSANIIKVLEQAREMEIRSFAILGFSGGKCKQIADVAIHFPVNDMQISEDLQLVVGHMIMQWLYANRENKNLNK